MTNIQLFVAVAIPTLAILLNYVSTHNDLRQLRSEVNELRVGLNSVQVSLANLRAELYEKFALRGETTP